MNQVQNSIFSTFYGHQKSLITSMVILFYKLPLDKTEKAMAPLQYSCLENPMDGGAWQAPVHGVAKSRTRLSDFTFMHWRRKWQPTPLFLPGESQGQGSLVGCRLWGRTESDTTKVTQQQQLLTKRHRKIYSYCKIILKNLSSKS